MAEGKSGGLPVRFTPAAAEKVLGFMQERGPEEHAVRLGIAGRSSTGFRYDLYLVGRGDIAADDLTGDAGGFTLVVDPGSAPKLRGAVVDYVTDEMGGSGLDVQNPNPVWDDPRAMAIQHVIDTHVNPGVASHGGTVELLDVVGNSVYLRLGGGCVGCGMVAVTLKQGIEVIIKQAVPEIEEVIDQTDHASGTNPYYQPAKA